MQPTVYMMLGLPGSGKTTFSKKLMLDLGIKRYSLDEEYSNLGGKLQEYRWDEALASKAEDAIKQQTSDLVASGESVILDFCPWIKDKRGEYRNFIKSIGASCHVYYFDVDKDELLRRLSARNSNNTDYQIVSPEMLDDFIAKFESPIDEDIEMVKSLI